jgi:sporulation protein YlmC with PRC-barrel domain
MKRFDSLTGEAGNALIGCEVIGEDGKQVGTLSGVWMDPSTHRVEFVGVKTNRIFQRTHPVPVRSVEIDENCALIKLPYSVSFIAAAPEFDPDSELAEVEKQQVTGYYQCFVPIRRVTAIEEIRPEQSIGQTSGSPSDKSPSGFEGEKNRAELERDQGRTRAPSVD